MIKKAKRELPNAEVVATAIVTIFYPGRHINKTRRFIKAAEFISHILVLPKKKKLIKTLDFPKLKSLFVKIYPTFFML
ncbi:hypothetical protein Aasi_1406 [Candidatus Amoebophilus asiaticus 5a2]|uniref:Uncharacterized protein n=1 Tax=Amoebophilus asiaticus (strain 5a2) TaxID=452471 RepID=B3EU00_AMOA5|nr:hypothetical protein Aasi_1406 [Candidatus Amoebophilus asiaticus 5a2]